MRLCAMPQTILKSYLAIVSFSLIYNTNTNVLLSKLGTVSLHSPSLPLTLQILLTLLDHPTDSIVMNDIHGLAF